MSQGTDDAAALTLLAAMVGTDYNPVGLDGWGGVKALRDTRALVAMWRRTDRGRGLVRYVADELAGQGVAPVELRKFFSRAREKGFGSTLVTVSSVIERERTAAAAVASGIARIDLLWRPQSFCHQSFVDTLRSMGRTHVQRNGADAVYGPLVHLEGERASRLGHERASTMAFLVVGATKARTWSKNAAPSSSVPAFQCLATVTVNATPRDVPDFPDRGRFVDYLRGGTTRLAHARLVRGTTLAPRDTVGKRVVDLTQDEAASACNKRVCAVICIE